MKPNDVAIRKRTQIAQANKTMFLWIAIASALVGSALVVSFFLVQKGLYAEKVLAAKQETVSTLDKNNKATPGLEDQIRVLDTNQALIESKANEGDQAVQVILDALPSEANSLALGASLQNKLLAGIPGLTLQTLQVNSVVGVETLSSARTSARTAKVAAGKEISFNFAVVGSPEAIKAVLQNMERSIRLIDVVSLTIENQQNSQLMTVQAKAYYEPTKTIELRDKKVPR